MKRLFAWLLCLLMCMSIFPVSAFADVTHTVSFSTRYGIAPVSQSVEDGGYASKEPEPAGDNGGRCFHGWLYKGEYFDFTNTPVHEDINLEADWRDHTNEKTRSDSCTEAQTVTLTCSYCGETYSATLPAAGHNLKYVSAKAATCEEDGYEAYYQCERCEALFADAEGNTPLEKPTVIEKLGHHLVNVEKQEASCGKAGCEAYQYCDREGCDYATEKTEIPATGLHQYDGLICTVCGDIRFGFTIIVEGPGSVSWNGNPVTSGEMIYTAMGQNITLSFQPDENAALKTANLGEQEITSTTFVFPASAENQGSTVKASFEQSAADAKAGAYVEVSNAVSDSLFVSQEEAIAEKLGNTALDIPYTVYDVTPCWDGDQTRPMSADDVKATGGITFVLPYPAAVPAANRGNYTYEVYHYNDATEELEDVQSAVAGASGITVTATSFSPFAVFAVPVVAAAATPTPSPSPSSTVLVNNKSVPAKPTAIAYDMIDDGDTQLGAIRGLVADEMEYVKSDSAPASSATWTKITSTSLPGLKAGTYYVRYRETDEHYASEAQKIVIGEYYTVTTKLLYGKGSVSSEADEVTNNVYLVKKGGDITFKFTPENHYWLYVINVNDVYVGQSNVKTTWTLKDVKAKTVVSYGFSDSSSSPKTGDESNVALWIAVAVVAAAGAAGITTYLVRRRKK